MQDIFEYLYKQHHKCPDFSPSFAKLTLSSSPYFRRSLFTSSFLLFSKTKPPEPHHNSSIVGRMSMPTQKLVFLFCLLIISFFSAPSLALSVAGGSSCSDVVFPDNQDFASCTDLPNLDSFFHWTYTPSSSTLHIAYRHSQVSSSMWVAWGINPTSKGMIGTQAIVAYPKPDGTVAVFTSPVDSYGTRLREGNLAFPVSDLSVMFLDNKMVIFATIELPKNTTSVNHVWQDGPVSGDNLGMHGVPGNHLQSMGNLNLSSGQAFGSHGGNSKTKLKIAHGVLNAVSWGIMIPWGFMAARYLKALGPQADPLWFYTHLHPPSRIVPACSCSQGSAYHLTDCPYMLNEERLNKSSCMTYHTYIFLLLSNTKPPEPPSPFFDSKANVNANTETGVSALSPDKFLFGSMPPSLALSVAGDSSCSDSMFPNNQVFASCTDLPNLDSFLHWTYTPSSSTLHIAYRHGKVSSSTWVAWGINPTSKGMIGTQAIVAYSKPDGTVAVFTSPVDSCGTRLQEGTLTFPVSNLSAIVLENEMVIFATNELPENTTSVNHAHGVLNAVSWGIMMPLGFMAARYLKALGPQADPLWFYTHVSLQLSGYFLGMAGGATGLVLGSMSSGNHHPCQMGIGITLFALGLPQISALFLQPAKDHKHRHIWNWFHHLSGYVVLLLSLVNIWVGFTILKPEKRWMIGYGSISGAIMLTSLILEVWKKMTRDGKTNGAQVNLTPTSAENKV
ncbi:hypothetical protein RHGRI_004285 [Rhododendron griersonianum]|uniref:Cytochrome b561 and DOMON domain-containing protein n=1 Tax=Rhododendron griersonianum TaxID=479676 RepID=A0AAV6LAD6_9ERIC|nr:hypothetical protein RHGRI_004285 [Rhododendron griersonianum]